MNTGVFSRDGVVVPTTDNDDSGIYQAACWSWALNGEFVSAHDEYSAGNPYEQIFTRNAQTHGPTALNNSYAQQIITVWPQARPYVETLDAMLDSVIGGTQEAQKHCRLDGSRSAVQLHHLYVNALLVRLGSLGCRHTRCAQQSDQLH